MVFGETAKVRCRGVAAKLMRVEKRFRTLRVVG